MSAAQAFIRSERWPLLPPFAVTAFLIAIVVPLQVSLGGTVITSVRVVVLLAILPLAFGLFTGRYGRVLPIDWLFLVHTIWIGISLGVTTPQQAVSQFGSVGSEFFGGYLIGRCLIRDREGFIAMVRLVLGLLVVLFPFVVVEMVTGRPPIVELLNKLPVLSSVGTTYTNTRMGLERVQGVFPHPIHFGLFCSSLFAIAFTGLNGTVSTVQRIFLTILVSFGTFASLSSGALLPMILQAALIGWGIALRGVPRRWLILGVLCMVGYTVIEIVSTRGAMIAILTRFAFSSHNVYVRQIIFDWGMMNILGSVENSIPPARLFGIGLNDWVRPGYMHSGSMDNFWLVMGVRYGIPGFVLVAGGMLWLIWKVGRCEIEASTPTWHLRRGWTIVFVSLTLSLSTVHVWGTMYAYVFFLLGTGAWFLEAKAEGGPESAATPAPRREQRFSRFAGGVSPAFTGRHSASAARAQAHGEGSLFRR